MPISPEPGRRGSVLVVGTTPDYIEWIRRGSPDTALFLTDPELRQNAKESCPEPQEEILCDLTDYEQAAALLAVHLHRWQLSLDGIACYDCESMELAAVLAERYHLPYPSVRSIRNCRDKNISKTLWKKSRLNCPEVCSIDSADSLVSFFDTIGGPLVIKPVCGSGSELVFSCASLDECRNLYALVHDRLQERRSSRLYNRGLPAEDLIIAEELVHGTEYSCDFMVDGDTVNFIRLSRKVPYRTGPFGTTEGYVLCNELPDGLETAAMLDTLRRSAHSLDITRGICMLDFMIRDRTMVLLELAPRPGGDCLPYLLRRARNLDIIQLNLDFSRGRQVAIPMPQDTASYLGIRILSHHGGTLQRIDTEQLAKDPRIMEIGLFREPGHIITLPPNDYDSWVLGYAVARLEEETDAEQQLAQLVAKLSVEIG